MDTEGWSILSDSSTIKKKGPEARATHILMKELEPSDIFPASIADIVQ
jgi:hypothetical protein